MKNAIILHGSTDKEEYYSDQYPSLSNSHWLPWLQKQLLIRDIFTQNPEMPVGYRPAYSEWKHHLERFDISENTILVGHSCGGGFLVRWLSENQVKVAKLVLVAPWIDPNNHKQNQFFDFTIDPALTDRIEEAHLLISDDDTADIHTSVNQITHTLPSIQVHRFTGKGHFTLSDLGTEQFPELLKIITDTRPNKDPASSAG